jgi:hypothetical protein
MKKQIIQWSFGMLFISFIFSCSKAPQQIATQDVKSSTTKTRTAPGVHMALGRAFGPNNAHKVYQWVGLGSKARYTSMGVLTDVNTGLPITAVTGLACNVNNGLAYCLSKANSTTWKVWQFFYNDPTQAYELFTLSTSNTLSDLDYDSQTGEFVALNTTLGKVLRIIYSGSTGYMSDYCGYFGVGVPNVNALCKASPSKFAITGYDIAGNGYLPVFNSLSGVFNPATPSPYIFTTSTTLIPSVALTAGGVYWDPTSLTFIVAGTGGGATGSNWAQTVPPGMSGTIAPAWYQTEDEVNAKVYILDFAPSL